MTSPECPVCATPHEAGAATCAFCGVSLLEPPTETESKPETESTPQPTAEPEARAEATPSPEPAAIAESVADEPAAPAPEQIDEDDGDTETPADDSTPEPVDVAATAETADAEPETTEATEPPENPEIPGIPAPQAQAPGTRSPSFARKPTSASAAQRRARRIEWSVVGGLAALLLVQMVASDFDQLAASSTTRPWLQRACAFLRCTLPAWREPQALRLLQRDVHANPDRPGLLRISASFRNDARWMQPWPRLRVILSDADGRAVAARDFNANEYLGTPPTANGIASGQVAGVAVDVVDPSPHVTAFTFEFR